MIQSETVPSPTSDGSDHPVSVLLRFHSAPNRGAPFQVERSRVLASLRDAPGCRAVVELGPPPETPGDVCVVAQFDGAASWRLWRDGSQWAGWFGDPSERVGSPTVQECHGSAARLVLPALHPGGPPPRRKMAVVMWISVYPTITALLWLLWPLVQGFPLPLRTLALSVVMVPLMVWVIVPWVTARLAPWLRATGHRSGSRQAGSDLARESAQRIKAESTAA